MLLALPEQHCFKIRSPGAPLIQITGGLTERIQPKT